MNPDWYFSSRIAELRPRQHLASPSQSTQNMPDLSTVCYTLDFEVGQLVQYLNYLCDYENIIINLRTLSKSLTYPLGIEDGVIDGMNIVKTCMEGLQDGLLPVTNDPKNTDIIIRYKQMFVNVLKSLQDTRAFGQHWINQQVTRLLTDCKDHLRYNISAVDTLIRAGLVNVPQYDLDLAQVMDNGKNDVAVTFATKLVQLFLIEDRSNQFVTESNFTNTTDMLKKIAMCTPQPPESATNVSEMLIGHEQSIFFDSALAGPLVHIDNGVTHVASFNFDPPTLVSQTNMILRIWVEIYDSQLFRADFVKEFSMFVSQMNVCGVLKTDDIITRFFRLSTKMSIESFYKHSTEYDRDTSIIRYIDPLVRLIVLLVKHANAKNTRITVTNKMLGIVAGYLLQDHEQRNVVFNELPYHRMLITLFLELCSPEPVLEAINFQVLTAYGYTLHILRPTKAPGFCYAWLELISHRVFVDRMLAINAQHKGGNIYAQLLIDIFEYLSPFIRNNERNQVVTKLYEGTCRVFRVLLQNFPDFLCGYCYGFCDAIPPNCIQMRNLILSATPRRMLILCPFTPNLKVDVLKEMTYPPRVLTNYTSLITPPQFKSDLDSYLKLRVPITFLSKLKYNLQVLNEPGMRYNIPLMNALVMYVGKQAIAYNRSKNLTPNMSRFAHGAHMDIFQSLAVDLDTEGRYLFFNTIANQLRYPNSHTHYFMYTLLYLFVKTNGEAIQEQIARVLHERIIVGPRPWGLWITYMKFLKNRRFKSRIQERVRGAPET